MKSDIEIARSIELKKIKQVAESVGIPREEVENYGRYIAKIPEHLIDEEKVKQSNLILVTAITATKAGIGKTTVSIGLALGLNKIGKKAIVALREPSLGPCFGMKGGAAGGGYAQVVPMEDINLHAPCAALLPDLDHVPTGLPWSPVSTLHLHRRLWQFSVWQRIRKTSADASRISYLVLTMRASRLQ